MVAATETELQNATRMGITQQIETLPMLPSVAIKVLQMVDEPGVTPRDLKAIISLDPALCSRILKVVNSSLYGQSRQVGDIDRAVMILGLKVIRNLTIVASMDRFFHTDRDGGAFRSFSDNLWRHSTMTATAAKIISTAMPIRHPEISSDEFFVAGLIHDIGIMAELHMNRTSLIKAITTAFPSENLLAGSTEWPQADLPRADLRDLEVSLFGLDHTSLGFELCNYWHFPEFLCDCVAWHHTPTQAPPDIRLAAIVLNTADRMAASLPNAFRYDLPSIDFDEDLLAELKLDLPMISELLEKLIVDGDTISEILS